jgi:hypothetical protein
MNIDVETLTPVVAGAEAATYNEVLTRHAMYVPRKYLPLLLMRCMTPKEAFLAINAEAVTQGEQDALDRELTGLESQSLGLLQTTPPHPWWRARFRQPSRLWTASLLKNNVLWLRGTYQLGVLPTQQRVAVLPRQLITATPRRPPSFSPFRSYYYRCRRHKEQPLLQRVAPRSPANTGKARSTFCCA